jgi:hypothetical protein
MGKQVAAGTANETRLRKRAEDIGRRARRTAKAGQAHEADLIIEGAEMRPVVAWKNMIAREGRRKSVRMIIMLEDDWFDLVALDTEHRYGYAIQAKQTQRLAVRAILTGLADWMKRAA